MIIALVGRRIDPPHAATAVFPLTSVQAVRLRIHHLFEDRVATALVCSAACGADLLALQEAAAMGMRRRVILPFEPNKFRESSVIDRPGDWGEDFDRVIAEMKATNDLVTLDLEPADESYLRANQAILEESLSLAVPRGDNVVAVLVWNGVSRGEDDITNQFGDEARSLGIEVIEISTL